MSGGSRKKREDTEEENRYSVFRVTFYICEHNTDA